MSTESSAARVAYLAELLRQLGDRLSAAFARLQFVEQPMPHDLESIRDNRVHAAAALVPIVIDESFTGPGLGAVPPHAEINGRHP